MSALDPTGVVNSGMNVAQASSRVRGKLQFELRRRLPSKDFTFPLGVAGRLGNQLWQISGTIAIAKRHGAEAVFRSDWPYRRYIAFPKTRFAGPFATARCRDAWPLATEIVGEWRINLQDIGLWADYEDLILGELSPSRLALDAAGRFADLLALPSATALHVRRGDYTSGLSFHRPCPTSYYEQALKLLQQDVPDATLLVFSDDVEWCRDNLRLDADMHFIDGNPDWVDLTIMSLCRHHICANSTFSWWGALMSKDSLTRRPSPIVPWLHSSPDAFRAARPLNWRELEVDAD